MTRRDELEDDAMNYNDYGAPIQTAVEMAPPADLPKRGARLGEATIIVPRWKHRLGVWTALRHMPQYQFESDLVARFGGWTSHDANGAWYNANTGQTIYDTNVVYTIAMPITGGNRAAFWHFATEWGQKLEQQAVYTSFAGDVKIILITKE